jgi:hypothetical protein
MNKFQHDNNLMITLRSMGQGYTKANSEEFARNFGPNITPAQFEAFRSIYMMKQHWPSNMAAIARKNPAAGQIPVSFLRNEDVIAALHGIALGICPIVAVELAYKDMLVFDDLKDGHCCVDPIAYRLVATVTAKGDNEPRLALFVHKDAASYAMEWDADECALLHHVTSRNETVLMGDDFWPQYMAKVGMSYDESQTVLCDEELALYPSQSLREAAGRCGM